MKSGRAYRAEQETVGPEFVKSLVLKEFLEFPVCPPVLSKSCEDGIVGTGAAVVSLCMERPRYV